MRTQKEFRLLESKMKTSVFLFLLLLACAGRTQNLLDERNLWMNVIPTINSGVYYEFFDIQGDTVIASKTYKKLYRKTDDSSSEWEYIYGMREDSSQKVYFVLREDEEERLLYDFNLQLDDTFFICNRADIYVTSIDTIFLLNGEPRKRIQFEPGPDTWIEGIGSIDGIVADGGFYYCNTTGEAFPFLNCFATAGEVLYKKEWSTYPCLDGTTALHEPVSISLQIYPNPFNSTTTLVLPDTRLSGELFVFSILGELVDHRIIEDQHTTLYRGVLPDGIYIYKFVSREGQSFVEKVVVE
jgi:hypothetical protein